MASSRDCPCDSASSRQEAKSHGLSLQEAIYQAQQSRQEARDRGQSRWKPNMTDSLCRMRKLADSLIPCATSPSSGQVIKINIDNVEFILTYMNKIQIVFQFKKPYRVFLLRCIFSRRISSYLSIPEREWASAPLGPRLHYFSGMDRYSDFLRYVTSRLLC